MMVWQLHLNCADQKMQNQWEFATAKEPQLTTDVGKNYLNWRQKPLGCLIPFHLNIWTFDWFGKKYLNWRQKPLGCLIQFHLNIWTYDWFGKNYLNWHQILFELTAETMELLHPIATPSLWTDLRRPQNQLSVAKTSAWILRSMSSNSKCKKSTFRNIHKICTLKNVLTNTFDSSQSWVSVKSSSKGETACKILRKTKHCIQVGWFDRGSLGRQNIMGWPLIWKGHQWPCSRWLHRSKWFWDKVRLN